jgi:hypothetical protein
MSTAIGRDYSLRVRMAAEEKRMLEALAVHAGVTVSDWVRLTIRKEFGEFAVSATPKPKPKR